MNVDSIKKNAKILLELLDNLPKGVSYKKVAKEIKLNHTQLSNLKNKILPKLIAEYYKSVDEIEETIKKSGNLRLKIFKEFPFFIKKIQLGEFSVKKEEYSQKPENLIWKNAMSDSIRNSRNRIIDWDILGLYETYLNFENFISKKSLQIMANPQNGEIVAYYGNKKSRFRYKGIAQLLGSHSLQLSLIDYPENIMEVYTLNFSIPFNPKKIEFLRGIFLCIDPRKQPFSGRIIAVKKGKTIGLDLYDDEEAKYYGFEDKEIPIEIRRYLESEHLNSLRCTALPDPAFGLANLNDEKKWLEEKKLKYNQSNKKLEILNMGVDI